MSIKNYWFIIMAPDYKRSTDRTHLNSKSFSSIIIAVPSIEEACVATDEMIKMGVEVIELCWWFERDWYEKIVVHVQNKVPVGYVVFNGNKTQG